ncbi:class F sortase [Xylanimonas allomyrinae]|uniref:class F sortase n=1 Tax=Xylanimonas allomyrinae TaxID=2509459 RepID=UPI0013A60177|nr:class F sortase [Xylanimonas allomyrinae]
MGVALTTAGSTATWADLRADAAPLDSSVKVVPPPPQLPEPDPEPEPVPAATPIRVLIPAIGVDAPIEVYTDEMVAAANGWIDPSTADVVSWWQGGGTPSSNPDNTVYLYGHVSRLEAVFNHLHTVTPGTVVTVVTEAGEIHYEVQEILEPVSKEALPYDERINEAVPGRLVIIGCFREPDQGRRPTTHNTVVIAHQIAG